MHHRRLARDYEALPHRSEAVVHLAMIDLRSRGLTREIDPELAPRVTTVCSTVMSSPAYAALR